MAALTRTVSGAACCWSRVARDEGVTNRGIGPLRLIRQGAHHQWPGVQPQAEHHTAWLPPDRIRDTQTLAELEGGQYRPAGMILLRHWRPEQRQETLA